MRKEQNKHFSCTLKYVTIHFFKFSIYDPLKLYLTPSVITCYETFITADITCRNTVMTHIWISCDILRYFIAGYDPYIKPTTKGKTSITP